MPTIPPILPLDVHLELSSSERMSLLQNSIERVFNNAIDCGHTLEHAPRMSQSAREAGSTLWQDCDELKSLVDKLWRAAANALRAELLQSKP